MILIDTTPLVALCDPRDGLHKTALGHLKHLARSQFAVSEPVLSEACFHLSAPSQRQRLRRTLDDLEVEPASVSDDGSLWQEVFDWLNKYADHQPDWADGYLAVLCSRDRSYKLWTYDIEFRTTLRRRDGSMIPMAIRRSTSVSREP